MDFSLFDIPWLDRCFQRCFELEDLEYNFSLVSDGLACLSQGSYDSQAKQAALMSLLGPAFVYKHFGKNVTGPRGELAQNIQAGSRQIEKDLEELARVAMERHFPVARREEASQKVREKVVESLHGAISSRYRESESDTDSVKSLTLGQEEEYDEISTLIGKSIEALIEYEEKNHYHLNLRKLAKEVFRENFLAVPQDLRRQFWGEELRKHSSRPLRKPENMRSHEGLISKNVKLGEM